jgi:hypothetical protein
MRSGLEGSKVLFHRRLTLQWVRPTKIFHPALRCVTVYFSGLRNYSWVNKEFEKVRTAHEKSHDLYCRFVFYRYLCNQDLRN